MNRTKDAFLEALRKDKYDECTRRIYADWLEEMDEPEEAQKQRAWTRQWQEAEDWLTQFAVHAALGFANTQPREPEQLLRELVQAVQLFLKRGDLVTFGDDLGFTARNAYDENPHLFWDYWQTYTRASIDERVRGSGGPFSCCY